MTSFDFSKAEIFGDEYIQEYAEIEFEKLLRERRYQNYIAAAAEFIAGNTAGIEERKYLTCSYPDLFEPTVKEPETTESVEEIRKKQHEVWARLTGGDR